MALQITATVVLPREVTDRLVVSEDKDTAARQIADFLVAYLPSEVLTLLTIDVRETKKDGSPKKNADTSYGSYAA